MTNNNMLLCFIIHRSSQTYPDTQYDVKHHIFHRLHHHGPHDDHQMALYHHGQVQPVHGLCNSSSIKQIPPNKRTNNLQREVSKEKKKNFKGKEKRSIVTLRRQPSKLYPSLPLIASSASRACSNYK